MRVICDFDGTITRQDSTDLVLETLAAPAWLALQDDWIAGRISGAACMRGQVSLIGGTAEDLDRVLDSVDLDPGFPAFVAWIESLGIPLSIVSDGVDYFIHRILARHGLDYLPVTANRLTGKPGARGLSHPPKRSVCVSGAGVCKCAVSMSAADNDETTVFVGDGRSDFCISGRADILFAKGALADHAKASGTPYLPFDTFDDVRQMLAALVEDLPAKSGQAATL